MKRSQHISYVLSEAMKKKTEQSLCFCRLTSALYSHTHTNQVIQVYLYSPVNLQVFEKQLNLAVL